MARASGLNSAGEASRQQQFALLGKDDQLVPGQDQRAERGVFARPLQFAGGQVEAAEVGVLLGLAVEGIQIVAQQNARAQVIAQDPVGVSDLRACRSPGTTARSRG